jgi:hypothetical protein
VLLVALQKSFSTAHILGEFVSLDDSFHVVDPVGEIAVVGQEPVEEIAFVQLLFPLLGFGNKGFPVGFDFIVFLP